MGTFWEMVNQQDPQHRQRYSKDMKEETKVYPEFEVRMKYTFSLVRLYINRLNSYYHATIFRIFII